MTIRGWNARYRRIAADLGYSRAKDRKAAERLDAILGRYPLTNLRRSIRGRPVFVVGSGPSLDPSIPVLRRYPGVTKICADTAAAPLVRGGITPQIIVTDLDGDMNVMRRLGKTGTIFVVHAHGDNIDRLEIAGEFGNCVGTTQAGETGKIRNFGGFTDGDRCVFLADFFGASKIFLFGMDFGGRIGRHSDTARSDRKTKLRKLEYGRSLLEWMAPRSGSELFTLSRPIAGFSRIGYDKLDGALGQ